MKMRIGLKDEGQLKCENCGAPLSEEVYTREIDGKTHYFCCSHCADDFQRRRQPSTQSCC